MCRTNAWILEGLWREVGLSGPVEIAERVSYGSETALSRAYKRWLGVAPAE